MNESVAKSDGTGAPTASGRLIVELSADKLVATVRTRLKSLRGEPLTAEEVCAAVSEQAVELTDQVRTRIEAYLELAKHRGPIDEPFVVADVTDIVNDRNQKFIWDDRFEAEAAEWQEEDQANYYELGAIVTVAKDSIIGRLEMPPPPLDVCGKMVPHPQPTVPMTLGDNACPSPQDPNAVVAQIDGRVVTQEQTLSIVEVLRIPGDISFETGNIDSMIEVFVEGGIPDGFEAKSARSITVGRSIEAAQVSAAGDVVVKRGILGRGTGLVLAGGDIIAKHTADSRLAAAGDVKINRQIMNGTVFCGGKFVAGTARVIGGNVFATQGVEAQQLGNSANVPTRITVDVCANSLREAAQTHCHLRKDRVLAEKVQEQIDAAKNAAANLDTNQRHRIEAIERALAKKIQGMEEAERRCETLIQNACVDGSARVLVHGDIFGKVAIRIGDRETYFHKVTKGPVSIERRKVNNATEIVAVNKLSGSVKVLPNERHKPDDVLDGVCAENDNQ